MGIDIEHKREWTEEEIEIGNTKYHVLGVIVHHSDANYGSEDFFVLRWMLRSGEILGMSIVTKDKNHIATLKKALDEKLFVMTIGYTKHPNTVYHNNAPMVMNDLRKVEINKEATTNHKRMRKDYSDMLFGKIPCPRVPCDAID